MSRKDSNRLVLRQKRGVSLPTLLFLAWRNLSYRRLRTTLTISGVVVGVGAIFFLVSFGMGLQRLVTEEIVGGASVKSIDISSQNSRVVTLSRELVGRIEDMRNVEALGVSFAAASTLRLDESRLDTILYGVDESYQELAGISPIAGRLFEEGDREVMYLNQAALQAIGIGEAAEAIGQSILVSADAGVDSVDADKRIVIDKRVEIVGVIDSGSSSEAYVPLVVFEEAGVVSFDQVKLMASNVADIPVLRKQIESYGLQTTSPIDTLDQIDQIFRYFTVILIGLGAIGMIVAVLGMFNTFTMSLLERTNEIGVMIALGARHGSMHNLFIIESVLVSVIGSVLGIVTAIGLGATVNYVIGQMAINGGLSGQQDIDLFYSPWWLTGGLVMAMVLVGCLVALLPARHAARINPADSLRRL